MSIEVIGAGFGRTGTDSMREALTILGFGPCHHMYEVIAKEEQKRLWRALAKGGAPDWGRLFSGYSSCLDWPSAYYWRDLIAFYPQARVILTWRSPESWWESFEKTIVAAIGAHDDPDSLGVALIAKRVFGGRPQDRATAIAAYEANVEAVMATVPRERLLVHTLGDGWQPLCAHLGCAVPDQPYPNRNSAQEFRSAVPPK
ncbi:sulfotransferase family protein [Mesorhizobium sp. CU2]|uniref:sulfotransferase family protein n=1 Tax=unclassified Mesorhizobium TaxID=325217 RepID=UPI00112CB412|nr:MULTISPECIES: sulfotransferase family protein [unclassified Mesorhizobium]TPN76702.1 sulfotransferase family protein [Mesorhizobium sp. CU3]TPO01336.1 sulfotransferase family protein [Mesorhizobium sp. CU2]